MPFPALASNSPVMVIGGGISGLVCAYELRKRGHSVLLLEQSERVGGVIHTERRDTCLLEGGPQSFQSSQQLDRLLAELGLEAELVRADPRAARFIYFCGRLHQVPLGPAALLTTSLLSIPAKVRLLREPFIRAGNKPEESVAEFFRRRFGTEILERMVEPFLSGIYAGDPERLSLRAVFSELARFEASFGSVLRGFIKSRKFIKEGRRTLCSFREGLSRLPETLAAGLGGSVWCRSHVLSIRQLGPGKRTGYQLEVEHKGERQSLKAVVLVVATPAWEAARLVHTLAPHAAQLLEGLDFAALVVVWLCYRRSQIQRFPGGFGFLVPRSEGFPVLGTVFSSELFPGRAPADSLCLTSFVGGTTHPEVLQFSDSDLAQQVGDAIGKILGVEGEGKLLGVRRYAPAIPQYNLGYLQRREALFQEEARLPGFFLTGNYLGGVSIANCVDHATCTAERIANFLRSPDCYRHLL